MVMVVDDEPMIRVLVRSALTRTGYSVVDAESPAQAMGILDSLPALELLVTDVVMPEIDGCELAARMRQARPDLKILFMSGFPAPAKLPRLDNSTGFIAKPFTVNDLVEGVRRILPSCRQEPSTPAQRQTRPPISPLQ